MTTPSPRPKRGFLAAFQSAMAPPMPDDDGKPIVRPRIVTIGSVMAIIGGLLFLFAGVFVLLSKTSYVDAAKKQYLEIVNECTTYVGGIGTAVPSGVPTPTSASGPAPASLLPTGCPTLTSQVMSQSDIDGLTTNVVVTGVGFALAGAAAAVCGWYLRDAAKWARRVLVVIALLALGAAVLLGTSTLLTLVATLLVVLGLVLTYIGRGSQYFLRMAMRRSKHA